MEANRRSDNIYLPAENDGRGGWVARDSYVSWQGVGGGQCYHGTLTGRLRDARGRPAEEAEVCTGPMRTEWVPTVCLAHGADVIPRTGKVTFHES